MTKIISITGDLGSGKSTVSNILCNELHYDYVYTGKIQRAIAEKYNMTTLELNKYAETHREIDDEIDSVLKSLKNSSEIIIDSRLAWFFVPKSFKVFLKTNLHVAASRINNDNLRKNEKYSSHDDAMSNIILRKSSENKRYLSLYGANCSKHSNFNLIVDTSFITPETVAEIIVSEYKLWLENGTCNKAYISPTNLYPTLSANQINDEKPNGNITILNHGWYDYIIEGHSKISEAIKNKKTLIQATYKDEHENFDANINFAHEWEEFNSFKFLTYPKF